MRGGSLCDPNLYRGAIRRHNAVLFVRSMVGLRKQGNGEHVRTLKRNQDLPSWKDGRQKLLVERFRSLQKSKNDKYLCASTPGPRAE